MNEMIFIGNPRSSWEKEISKGLVGGGEISKVSPMEKNRLIFFLPRPDN